MREKAKARSSAGTPERTMEPGAASRQTTNSRDNLTMNTAQGQEVISSFLGHGQDAAVSLQQLVNMTGWDDRTIRHMIERERRAGVTIVSDNQHGYWLADDPAEIQQFARSMRRRAHEILTTASAVERAAGLD